jgi:epsilon-lactone hydrolase
MMRLRDEGAPLPAAAVVLSPWTDLALTGQSLTEYGCSDPMVPVELMPRAVEVYLAGADPRSPYASPLYGDPADLPPTLIYVGGDEALRDDAVRDQPAARSNSKYGRACSMSGLCSRASCLKPAQRSRPLQARLS